MKTRILFVDDEPNVLSALRRMFHDMRGQGEMDFGPLFAALLPQKPEIQILLENTTPQNAAAALAGVRAQISRVTPQPDPFGLPES